MNDPIWQFSLQATHALIWGGTLGIAMLLCVRAVKLRTVVYTTTILTLVLVTLGAYVRLTDAGLGCPDWPGCYGKLSPVHAEAEILDVHSAAPEGPVSHPLSVQSIACCQSACHASGACHDVMAFCDFSVRPC